MDQLQQEDGMDDMDMGGQTAPPVYDDQPGTQPQYQEEVDANANAATEEQPLEEVDIAPEPVEEQPREDMGETQHQPDETNAQATAEEDEAKAPAEEDQM